MAEGLARAVLPASVHVQSAGSVPTRVNPYAIRAMAALDIDLAKHTSKSVQDIDPQTVDLVVTLCAEEVCPAFLGAVKRLHWPLQDPDRKNEALSDEVRLQHFCRARDDILSRIKALKAQGF